MDSCDKCSTLRHLVLITYDLLGHTLYQSAAWEMINIYNFLLHDHEVMTHVELLMDLDMSEPFR